MIKALLLPLPLQLFSHNDQQVEWQSGITDKASATGWGGRLADLTHAFNNNNRISMSDPDIVLPNIGRFGEPDLGFMV